MKFSKLMMLGVSALALFVFVPSVSAETLYTYVGNPFNRFHGVDACPPECLFEGYFIIDGPPPINLTGGTNGQFQFSVTPIAYAFTDGNVLANSENGCADFFGLSTNSVGYPTAWTIRVFTPSTNAPCAGGGPYTGQQLLTTNDGNGNAEDITIQAPDAINFAASLDQPGVWTVTDIPEPGFAMIGLCFLGLVCLRRSFRVGA